MPSWLEAFKLRFFMPGRYCKMFFFINVSYHWLHHFMIYLLQLIDASYPFLGNFMFNAYYVWLGKHFFTIWVMSSIYMQIAESDVVEHNATRNYSIQWNNTFNQGKDTDDWHATWHCSFPHIMKQKTMDSQLKFLSLMYFSLAKLLCSFFRNMHHVPY